MKRSGTATVIVLNVQIVCSFICTIVSSQKCNWSRTDRTGIAIHKSLAAIFSTDLGLCINYNIFNRRIVTSNPMEPCLSFRLSNFTETGIKISYKQFFHHQRSCTNLYDVLGEHVQRLPVGHEIWSERKYTLRLDKGVYQMSFLKTAMIR